MAKFIKQSAGVMAEEATVQTSAGAGDSGKVPNLNASGEIDITMIPSIVGAETIDLEATEALAAGDLVNIFDDAGTAKARLADASDISTQANGFVISPILALATGTIFLEGTNDQLSGLTPGTTYFLSETPGAITLTAPTTSTAILQQVGRSHSATKLSFEAHPPIVLA